MAWAQDPVDGSERLFTGGLDGALTEWDLRTRRPIHVGDSFGGAIWAMAAEPRGQLKEGSCWLALSYQFIIFGCGVSSVSGPAASIVNCACRALGNPQSCRCSWYSI